MPLGGNRGGNYTARCCPGSYRRRTGLRSGTAYSVALMGRGGRLASRLDQPSYRPAPALRTGDGDEILDDAELWTCPT